MALGSGDATPSGPITATFDGAGAATIQAHTLGNVDQTNPVAHTYASGHGATTNSSVSRGGFFHGTELEAYGCTPDRTPRASSTPWVDCSMPASPRQDA